MGMYWRELFKDPYWVMRKTTEDFAVLTYEQPLAFEPGEQFQYSNCGPIVVGLIIEKLSGQSYDDYIREHVTGPAGINSDLRIYTDLEYTVAVMTNYDPPAAQKVAGKLKEVLTGE
jgi:CubicO group peptidase (beta-lactamase class C family)